MSAKQTVVVRRTSHTPTDALVGEPGLFLPTQRTVINVSCIFTADKEAALSIGERWREVGYQVNVGGPAFDDPGGEFTPGQYLRLGITTTSRGCPGQCPFCYVPKREGRIRELKVIHSGNIIQDNNLLACSRPHVERVFQMLRSQHRVEFTGGIDSRLLRDWHVEELRGLRISKLWMAADSDNAMPFTLKAISMLRAVGFTWRKVGVYVLSGYNGEALCKAEDRCRAIFEAGAMPFAMVWDGVVRDKEWRAFQKFWTRPAAYISSKGDRGRLDGRGKNGV